MFAARRMAVAMVVAILGLFVVPSVASAASPTYAQQIASSLKNSPVYRDPAASPTISNDQLNNLVTEIKGTGKPIYVILVDNKQAGSFSSPSQFLSAVHTALGKNSVIAVSSAKGFYANAYNLPPAVEQGAGNYATQVVNQAKNGGGKPDPYTVYSTWVHDVAGIQAFSNTSSSSHSSTTASAKHGMSGGMIALIIVGSVGLVILIIVIVMVVKVRRRKQTKIMEISDELEAVENDLVEISIAAEPESNEYRECNACQSDITTVKTMLDHGNTTGALQHLASAKKHLARANTFASGGDPDAKSTPHYRYDNVPVASSTRYTRSGSGSTGTSQSSGGNVGARLHDPNTGQPIVITQNTYTGQSSRMAGYGNYYGGGSIGGVYYPMGWYADPFWNWNVLETALVLDTLEDRSYEHGLRDGERDHGYTSGDTGGSDWTNADTSGVTGGANWSDDSSGNTGGSTWSGSDDSDSSWSSGSDTSGSSGWSSDSGGSDTSSSFDSGGSSDWSSGGSDSGW